MGFFGGAAGAFENALLHVRDEKAANTASGSSSGGAWNTRALNTAVINKISGASLSSNQVTLPAGKYVIAGAAPVGESGKHRLAFFNVTDAAYEVVGMCASGETTGGDHSVAHITGAFTIAAGKVFELRHYITSGTATDGLGKALNVAGLVEVYADLQIWKVG